MSKIRLMFVLLVMPALGAAFSANAAKLVERSAEDLLSERLAAVYPGTKIRLNGDIVWANGQTPQSDARIVLIRETPVGEAYVAARSAEGDVEGKVSFVAEMKSWVPIHRVSPGSALRAADFKLQNIVVSEGMAREYRGLLLSSSSKIDELEARQTLLEGRFVLSSAVQRIPDAQKGEPVRLQMRSGGVVLSTAGTTEESAYLDGPVRVMVQKSKRSLSGKLIAKGTVEIQL